MGLSVTVCQLVLCLKVLSLALWKKNAVTEVRLPKLLVLMLPSSPTAQILVKPESNFHLAPRNCTNLPTELWSVSSLVVDDKTNLCRKPVELITNIELSETAGLMSEVLP